MESKAEGNRLLKKAFSDSSKADHVKRLRDARQAKNPNKQEVSFLELNRRKRKSRDQKGAISSLSNSIEEQSTPRVSLIMDYGF